MIINIVDRRSHQYRWLHVEAIVEDAWHDNSVDGADQAVRVEPEMAYDERADMTITEAIDWAHELPQHVTLYLYDVGTNAEARSRND